jgi:hypothetical protein
LSDSILFERGGTPFATGVSRFHDGIVSARTDARIYLQVIPANLEAAVYAMVDTGAPWCIFDPIIGAKIFERLELLRERAFLQTRFGTFQGVLCRGSVTLVAHEGETLNVDAAIFLSPDWPGGNFLGYEGFLDRIRFAVDPHRNRFYFSSL